MHWRSSKAGLCKNPVLLTALISQNPSSFSCGAVQSLELRRCVVSKYVTGEEHPLMFLSKKAVACRTRICTLLHGKECTATLFLPCKKLKMLYLDGSHQNLSVQTDRQSLGLVRENTGTVIQDS
ncbi:hypothetical protein TNCV_4467601 [Trichonephila clavipes]|nr:hypothetical protein TNCV_4467601 [Trichonephila clavipes]